MSSKLQTPVSTSPIPKPIDGNPLYMLQRGVRPKPAVRLHKVSAAVGNLYFEYAQNVPTLRGIVRSGREIAEFLEHHSMISWERDMDRYTWKREPLTKAEFLQMVRPNPATLNV